MEIKWRKILEFHSKIKSMQYGAVTLKQLLEIAGIPLELLDKDILPVMDRKVRQISYAGKRMMSDSIAFGLFNESPRIMQRAVDEGAIVVIVKERMEGLPCIVVDDPTIVYAKMCAYFRDQHPFVKATAVIGSIGKTTVKNMVTAIYKEQFNTLTEPLNENEPDIVGFTAQHLSRRTRKWVQEVAESVPGTTQSMSLILKPEVVIITAIDKSHIGRLESMTSILDETCGITKHLASNGIVIVDKNDFPTMEKLKDKPVKTVSVFDESADYYATNITVKSDGLYFDVINNENGLSTPIHLQYIYAKHNVINALYAFAAGTHVGIASKNIARGLNKYKTTGYRNNVYKSANGKDIIYADCYNSIARSVRSAIDTASEIPIDFGCHRIAVLGDVQELGDSTAVEHLSILSIINESRFDILFLFGPHLHEAAENFKFREGLSVRLVDSISQIVHDLSTYKANGNLFLFKSSHSGHLEECIKRLWPREFMKREKEEERLKLFWKLRIIAP